MENKIPVINQSMRRKEEGFMVVFHSCFMEVLIVDILNKKVNLVKRELTYPGS